VHFAKNRLTQIQRRRPGIIGASGTGQTLSTADVGFSGFCLRYQGSQTRPLLDAVDR